MSKKSFFVLFCGLCLLAEPAVSKTRGSRSVNETGGDSSVWYGVASDTAITRTNNPAISLLFGLNDKFGIQTYTTINSASPFSFAVGGTAKYNVIGDWSRGFHLMGGLGLGTTATEDFFVNFALGAGFQWAVVERVLISVDTGLMIMAGGGQSVNIALGANSGQLGLSAHFRL